MRFILLLAIFLCLSFSSARAFDLVDGFGVHIKDELASADDLERMRAAGFSVVRFALGWQHVEAEKGKYDWSSSDALIARIRAARLKMVIPLLGGSSLYDGWVDAPPRNVDHVHRRARAPASPESVQAFARFAAATALRYRGDDIIWEIWNEPDLARFWPPAPEGSAYAALAERTCKTIRQIVPQAKIVGPVLGRVPDPRDGVTPRFFEDFLASGAAGCVDAISVHPYRHGKEKPEAAFKDYRRLFLLMTKHGVAKPLINTEMGYTTTQVPEEMQANYAMRTRLIDMMWGVPLTIWYEWRDSRPDPADPEGRFGLVALSGAPKPSFKSVADLWPQVRFARLERQIHTADPRDILLLLQDPDGTQHLVGWSLRDDPVPLARVRFTENGKERTENLAASPRLLASSPSLAEITCFVEGIP